MKKEYDYTTLTDFGFSCHFEERKLIVSSLTKGSIAEKDGLRLEDQIIEYNGMDCYKMSLIKWCEIVGGEAQSKEMALTVLRNEKKLIFNLTSVILLK